jgi:hypothetical protein
MVCGARFLVRGASKAGISRPSHTALAEAGTEKVQRQVPRWQNVSLPVDIGRGVGCGGLHRRRSEKRGRIGSSTSSESSAFLMQQEYVPVKRTYEGTWELNTALWSMSTGRLAMCGEKWKASEDRRDDRREDRRDDASCLRTTSRESREKRAASPPGGSECLNFSCAEFRKVWDPDGFIQRSHFRLLYSTYPRQ